MNEVGQKSLDMVLLCSVLFTGGVPGSLTTPALTPGL